MNKKLLLFVFTFSLFFIVSCATIKGAVPEQIIDQSAQVDTSISQLQTQQAESAIAGQKISDSADNIQKIAEKINVEATKENMILASNKKIVSTGNKK